MRIVAVLERDEADLIAYLADLPSQAVFVLRHAGDETAAMAALRRAADAVREIPHPIEPEDPLPNWVEAILGDDGPTLHLDMQDQGDYAPRVIAVVIGVLERAGVDGRLEPLLPPVPPFDYDSDADIVPVPTRFLAADDMNAHGLPATFPDGFPVPADAVLVIAQQALTDTWQHAGWRRSRPFTEYPDALRRFGCDLSPVTQRDRMMEKSGMTRHLFRHPTGTGSVSTYHEYDPPAAPRTFYVSVVWRPEESRMSA